jgi:hypothetical protein
MTKAYFGLVAVLVAGVVFGAGDEAVGSKPAATAGKQEQVDCGADGVDVTIALAYSRDSLGTVAGAYVDLTFATPLELPEQPTTEQLRGRLTTLLGPQYHVTPVSNSGGQRTIRLSLTTPEPEFPTQDAFKLRFDCRAGSRIRPRDVTCKTEVADGSAFRCRTRWPRVRCTVVRIEPMDSGLTQ